MGDAGYGFGPATPDQLAHTQGQRRNRQHRKKGVAHIAIDQLRDGFPLVSKEIA